VRASLVQTKSVQIGLGKSKIAYGRDEIISGIYQVLYLNIKYIGLMKMNICFFLYITQNFFNQYILLNNNFIF
jgi:hypothetical protein